jgi:hypothetical protein
MPSRSFRRILVVARALNSNNAVLFISFLTISIIALTVVLASPEYTGERRLHIVVDGVNYFVDADKTYLDKLLDPFFLLTVLIFISGYLLWISTDRLARATADQVALTHRQLVELERPWIVVSLKQGFQRPGQRIGSWWHAKGEIANHGKMPAIISFVLSGYSNGVEPEAPFIESKHSLVLGPGKTEPFEENVPDGYRFDESGNPIIDQLLDWYYVIQIDYSGVTGSRGASCFCWRYDRATGAWVIYGDKYNYLK